MKVVLFCGGMGMRIREDATDVLPKPMTTIGGQPMLWHIMKYYAHFGHTEFVLALGHGAQAIKDFFLAYRETAANDFVMRDGVELCSRDVSQWTITFCDTGAETAIGERLRRVREHLGADPMFLANYGDGLSDVDINDLVDRLPDNHVGSLLAVRPQDSFHVVRIDDDGALTGLESVAGADMRVNGGFFVLRQEIFDYLDPGDDLVMDACMRAAKDHRFTAHRYDGFWACMDTQKERRELEQMNRSGVAPWKVWQR
ncbi:MAG: glucose-1-phosphate cytidylyltransferase [Micrococcales bacterium]|nr:glucose-1-phosphate cytidylyltransferase [Micrococcales bacterium]MCL2667090.1 glucose-1-phosphate cytidylyltransferase [Micrococcales bacterium]